MSRRRNGFTIIEFMVAIGLLSVLMLAVTSSFVFQQQTYVVVDQVAEAKQNVRVIADLVEKELRNAGYMVPLTAATCGVDSVNGPDKLYVADYSRIVGMSALPTSLLTQPLGAVIQGVGIGGVGAGTQNLTIDTLDLDGVGGGSDFNVGSGVIIADRNGAMTGVACGTVTVVGGASLAGIPLQVDMEAATGALSSGTELVAVPAIIYDLNGTTLRRNGLTLVNQVEDFQIAWFFDLNDDQIVDPGEYLADGQGALDDYDANAVDASLLREVRINVVVRTRDEDPNTTWQGGIGQATENRAAASVAPIDGARRRVHTSTVRLRNNLS